MAHGFDQAWVDARQRQKGRQPAKSARPAARPANASARPAAAVRLPTGHYDPFLALLVAHGLPAPETEYQFHPVRRFKADYAWPAQKLIVERQGGLWAKDKDGENNRAKRAHTLPLAILRDYEKSNLAQLAGWTYLQFTPEQLDKGLVLETLKIRLG